MKHNRRSVRLKGYDYSQNGYYFVTICTKDRECLFGEVVDDEMVLNDWGKIAEEEIQQTQRVRNNVNIDCFVIMPNHIHILIVIDNDNINVTDGVGAYCNTPLREPDVNRSFASLKNNLGSIIRGLKGSVTTRIKKHTNSPNIKIWQRNYHESIVKNEQMLHDVRNYTVHNALTWREDRFFVSS